MNKLHGVHMLPTTEKGNLLIDTDKRTLILDSRFPSYEAVCRQHIYFTSDEEIDLNTVGTDVPLLFIQTHGDLKVVTYSNRRVKTMGGYKKIVAATDPILTATEAKYSKGYEELYPGLPLIPQDFIEAYLKNYNAGTPITQVMLEIEDLGVGHYTDLNGNDVAMVDIQLKIRERDNTVIVHPIDPKPITLNEMHENMQYYMEYCHTNGYVPPMDWLDKHKHFK